MKRLVPIAFLLATACAEQSAPPPPDTPPVGITRLAFEDPERVAWIGDGQRPLRTTLWYPAAEGSAMAELSVPADRPIFVGGYAARDAEIAEGGPYPLIVLSHGTGGSAFQLMWLGRRLAAEGYLVAAVDHHGNTAAEEAFDPRGFQMMWHRALDISSVIDQLLVSDRWSAVIDADRIGAAGFSLGGYTMVALAGGVTDLDKLVAFCESEARDSTCEPQPEYPEAAADLEAMMNSNPSVAQELDRASDDYRDRRIRSFAMIAPALGYAFTDESLETIEAPALIVVGEDDRSTPLASNAAVIADHMPDAALIPLDDVDHYTFLNPCTRVGQRVVPICKERDRSRDSVHADVAGMIQRHFEESL